MKLALVMGCAQIFALFPGISRSGITISTLLILGVNQNTISNFGSVSKETAREMALGIRKMYKSKIGVGIILEDSLG